jgi:dihydrodipicolinate synthase/N-acetylneuraminate lyase
MLDARVLELVERVAHGVTPAMATPLTGDGLQVKLPAVDSLIEFLIAAGVKGLFVGGTTGEGILLERQQRQLLHEQAMKAIAGRVPALIHVGANTTAESVALAAHAHSIAADAIVAVTPTFYPMHDSALAVYFHDLAMAAPGTPLLAYDIPHMAVNGVSPALLTRLAAELPSFAGIKTSNQDAQAIRRLVDAAPAGYIVLAGNERIALGSLSLGASGLISGLSTAVPEPFVRLTAAFFGGDMAEAQKQQRTINAMLDLIPSGARMGALKSLLCQRGIDVGPPVPPRPALTAGQWPAWPKFAALLE